MMSERGLLFTVPSLRGSEVTAAIYPNLEIASLRSQ
jgi:hypothetical protein